MVRPGAFDRRVLDQDRIWVTQEAEVRRLEDMSTAHLLVVKALLLGRARALHFDAIVNALVLALAY